MESSNKKIIEKYIKEVWGGGNYRLIEELLTPNFAFSVSMSNEIKDKHWYARFVPTMRSGFINISVEILNIVEDDYNVAVYFRIKGKQAQDIMGVASKGNQVCADIMSFFTLKEGRITYCQSVTDLATIKQQMGK